MKLFEVDYYGQKLNVLELFEEGEFILADKIKIRRYYSNCPTSPDPDMYCFLTEISDVTIQQKHASLAMVHGFAQCQDVFIEAALHFALNGFYVYLVDLEGFGFSGGCRVNKLTIDKFHHQVNSLLEQVKPDLPCFLLGHSMGGLVVNSYLGYNPEISKRLAGVIYSAPFYAMPDGQVNFGMKVASHCLKHVLEEFVLAAPLQLHKVCKKKIYMRQMKQQRKAHPLLSLGLISSFISSQDRLMAFARKVTYPYLMVLGEKDEIVNNKVNRAWHAKTSSNDKQIKLMVGAFHELSKEPNNHVLFESVIRFMSERIPNAKGFGQFSSKRDYKAPVYRAPWTRKRFWLIMLCAYLLVGLLVAVMSRQKRLFFSWPSILVIAKRLK
jgi:alpha-beta hydrolase superfamily lysophospholipase